MRGRSPAGVWCRPHAVLNLSGHGHEGLFNVARIFGRSFQERNPNLFGKLFSGGKVDHFFIGHVALVADQQFVDAVARIAFNFVQPLFHIVERFQIGYVVHDDDSMRSTIIRGGDGAET